MSTGSPMNIRLLPIWVLLAICAPACDEIVGRPPVNLLEYNRMQGKGLQRYPDQTIYGYNMRRVFDALLPAGQRVESLHLGVHLGGNDPRTAKMLVDVLERPDKPKQLHYAVLKFVLRKGEPAVAQYAVEALNDPELPSDLRDALLGWLAVNARPEVLAQVVKLWAQEESITSLNEPRYRQVIERITGKNWAEALLSGINAPGFLARGSALEILTARVDASLLTRRIQGIRPVTSAMRALQEFARQLGYLPADGSDFLAATYVYNTHRNMLGDVARFTRVWQKEVSYSFVIRDFHILSRLAQDPLRKQIRRSELIVEVGRAVAYRRHVERDVQGRMQKDSFPSQVANLTMADLWNLYLINEMLNRPRVQLALGTVAKYDLADKKSAWGGLV
ncbi:MAG: hypothetical protein ACYTF6_02480, partial [Planctomycetota bacterium]